MDNAKKIKTEIEAQGQQVDTELLRQTYVLPNFEKGIYFVFFHFVYFLIFYFILFDA